MAVGKAAYIISALAAGMKDPQNKVDMHGFTKFAYTHPGQAPIQTTTLVGGKREVRFWYSPRFTKSMVDSSYECNDVNVPARIEATVAVTKTSKLSIFITQELMKQYEDEASQTIGINGSNIPVQSQGATQEINRLIISACNALTKDMNDNLLGQVSFGKNSVTGLSTTQSINFPLAATSNDPLNNGWGKVLYDYKFNGLTGRPVIIGGGYAFQSVLRSTMMSSANQMGIDNRIQTAMFDFYGDQDYDAIIGTNQFMAVEPGSLQVVEYMETSYKPGKLGVSEFFRLRLPTVDPNGNAIPLEFDCQIREIDCPTTSFTDTYAGGYLSAGNSTRGYQLIIWKNYDLFQIQSNNYHSTDVQYQNNGVLRFTGTNS